MPAACAEFTADELANVLAEHRGRADDLLALALALQTRLPGTATALRDGIVRLDKAQIIGAAAAKLDPEEAQQAEAMVLGRAGRLTPGGLRSATAHAVIDVNPDKARKRREEAARDARVQQWAEDSGNAALMGRELPPAEVLAADRRITAWARELKKADPDGDMDVLRARAYLDLLLGKDSRPGQDTASGQDGGGPDGPGDGDGDGRGGAGRGGSGPGPAGPGNPAAGPHASAVPAGFAGRITLTIPLATLLGLAGRPAEIGGIGPIDPALARDLANAAAANPRSRRQSQDQLVHDRDRPGRPRHRARLRPAPTQEPRPPPRQTRRTRPAGRTRSTRRDQRHSRVRILLYCIGPGRAARRIRHLDAAYRGHRPAGPARRARPDHHPGLRPPLRDQGPRSRDQAPPPEPDPACPHPAPTCRRPASNCDFEHNIPYEAGGRSCLCNGGPPCKT